MENTYKKRNFVYEMANLKPEKTGQPFELWIDELGKNRIQSNNRTKFKLKANNIELDVIITSSFKAEIINADQQKNTKI